MGAPLSHARVMVAAAMETPASHRAASAADPSLSPGASGTLLPRRPSAQVGFSDELHSACLEFFFHPRADGAIASVVNAMCCASGTGVIGTRVLRSRLMRTKVLSDETMTTRKLKHRQNHRVFF